MKRYYNKESFMHKFKLTEKEVEKLVEEGKIEVKDISGVKMIYADDKGDFKK